MSRKKRLRALIVDDEKVVRDFLVKFLRMEDVESVQSQDASSALRAMETEERFDMVFLDVRMPSMDGVELFRRLKKIDANSNYIMMTGYAVDDMLKTAEREGAIASLKKPFDLEEIKKIITRIRGD